MIGIVAFLFLLQLSICVYGKELEAITSKVYFDIEIGGTPAGRVVMGLFGNG